METIQDTLREEARDYQELAAMSYKVMWRERLRQDWPFPLNDANMACSQDQQRYLYRIARAALFELIGAEPEGD